MTLSKKEVTAEVTSTGELCPTICTAKKPVKPLRNGSLTRPQKQHHTRAREDLDVLELPSSPRFGSKGGEVPSELNLNPFASQTPTHLWPAIVAPGKNASAQSPLFLQLSLSYPHHCWDLKPIILSSCWQYTVICPSFDLPSRCPWVSNSTLGTISPSLDLAGFLGFSFGFHPREKLDARFILQEMPVAGAHGHQGT